MTRQHNSADNVGVPCTGRALAFTDKGVRLSVTHIESARIPGNVRDFWAPRSFVVEANGEPLGRDAADVMRIREPLQLKVARWVLKKQGFRFDRDTGTFTGEA